MTKEKTWKSICFVTILTVSLLVLPTISMALAQSPDRGKDFFQINPGDVGKSPLTTPPKAGEISVTTNTVELREEATGEIKVKAGTPKNFIKPAGEAMKMVAEEAKSMVSSQLQKTEGKPLSVDVIDDQKGTTQKFEITNTNDQNFQNVIKAIEKFAPPPGESLRPNCWQHLHASHHYHAWGFAHVWGHIHLSMHWHCISTALNK